MINYAVTVKLIYVFVFDSGARGRGFDPYLGHRVESLSKTHLPPKSTGNTHEAKALSQHDWKIVYWDVKNQINQPSFTLSWTIHYMKNLLHVTGTCNWVSMVLNYL